ncbi:MAG: DNA repair protein RecO [Deltaproteobacteria bacterium]|nr:DNA repair protein RecO [Deltaproteobacteria bacterium]
MRDLRDDVVVCGLVPYGEADLVVHLFTRAEGRLGAFARGAKRSRRRFPALSAPALGRAALRERRAAELWDLLELDVDPVVLGLAADPRALGHAAYLTELCERMLPEAEPSPEVFDLLWTALRLVATGGAQTALLRAFEIQLLRQLGWLPELTARAGPVAALEVGGLVGAVRAGTVPFDDETRAAALALLVAPLDALPAFEATTLRAVSRLFAAAWAQHVGRPLKSVAFLRALAAADVSATDAIAVAKPSR